MRHRNHHQSPQPVAMHVPDLQAVSNLREKQQQLALVQVNQFFHGVFTDLFVRYAGAIDHVRFRGQGFSVQLELAYRSARDAAKYATERHFPGAQMNFAAEPASEPEQPESPIVSV